MSRLTRDGTAELVSRDQILRHARGQGNIIFPCSADHEQDWQPYPVDPYSAICDDHTYIHTYHRQKRRSVGDRGYDDRGLDGRRMAGEIQSPQYNPVSRDRSGLSSHSGDAADGHWTCPSRVDTVGFSRGGYPLGPTEHLRSGIVSSGSAHEEFPSDSTQTIQDGCNSSKNMWGEDWNGRAR